MSRRIEIELTSQRPDGTWTWRAAGAKQPKGEMQGTLVPEGVKVGDVVKADADFTIDGIDILALITTKRERKEPELLTILGSGREEPLVTTKLVGKSGRGDGERRPRRDRDRDRDRDRGGRGERDGGDRRQRSERSRDRGPRPERAPERPRPKRLRAGRAHRAEVLNSLSPEQQPIAEQVLRGGIPAVREAIAKQNAEAKKENRPEIPADQLVDLAEKMLPKLRAAEWRDRADAALAGIEEIDLRDLRSVIVAADSAGRDPEALSIRDQIQEGLARRVEQEHTQWIDDMKANLDSGRFIRVLRLSSRPPKAGTPIPVDISSRLVSVLTEKLTADLSHDLWAQTLDALAFSPVRSAVSITVRPEDPSADLIEAVKRVGSRLPEIAVLFGLDPAKLAAEAKQSRPARSNRSKGKAKPDTKAAKDESKPETDATEDSTSDSPEAEAGASSGTETAAPAEVVDAPAAEAESDDAPESSAEEPTDEAADESGESAEPTESAESDAAADGGEPVE